MLSRDALGVGLRVPHYREVVSERPSVDYFELLSENHLGLRTPARAYAERVAAHYPVVLHGVGLNLLGHEPLDETHIDAVGELADAVDALFVSDHLCWSAAGAMTHHDLLPVPLTEPIAHYGAARAAYVQHRIGRPFVVENLSSYVQFRESTMTEWAFVQRVVDRADCGLLLDLNNVWVSSLNAGFDPRHFLDGIDFAQVAQVHLAGHDVEGAGVIVDTHDRPVVDDVWALYADAWTRGPFPTLLEWDDAIPPFPRLLEELERAREVRSRG